jgi:hypothetical protein
MTKREWVIVQQAMSAYADYARYDPVLIAENWWDDADGSPPSGGEIDGAMRELEKLVGRPEDAK